jgi:hypothetical protein
VALLELQRRAVRHSEGMADSAPHTIVIPPAPAPVMAQILVGAMAGVVAWLLIEALRAAATEDGDE